MLRFLSFNIFSLLLYQNKKAASKPLLIVTMKITLLRKKPVYLAERNLFRIISLPAFSTTCFMVLKQPFSVYAGLKTYGYTCFKATVVCA